MRRSSSHAESGRHRHRLTRVAWLENGRVGREHVRGLGFGRAVCSTGRGPRCHMGGGDAPSASWGQSPPALVGGDAWLRARGDWLGCRASWLFARLGACAVRDGEYLDLDLGTANLGLGTQRAISREPTGAWGRASCSRSFMPGSKWCREGSRGETPGAARSENPVRGPANPRRELAHRVPGAMRRGPATRGMSPTDFERTVATR